MHSMPTTRAGHGAGSETFSHELSVVIPCLNEADTLAVCVEKAQRAMREHGIDGEIIVADNGSIDGSQAIAARRGARARDPSRPTRRSGRLTE